MKRFVCVALPSFPTDTLRRRRALSENTAIILYDEERGQRIVRHCSGEAAALGVKQLMPLSLAETLAPNALIAPFHPGRTFKALYQLALWALRFSPLVGIDSLVIQSVRDDALGKAPAETFGFVLDISGTERVHHSEEALCLRILGALERAGIAAHIGVAGTIGHAWALSRFSERPITIDNSNIFPRHLPLLSLRLSSESIQALERCGVCSVGELHDLPRSSLPIRLGEEILSRLDSALGYLPEPIHTIQPEAPLRISRHYDGGLSDREQFAYAVQEVAGLLAAELRQRHQLLLRGELIASGRSPLGVRISRKKLVALARPTRDEKELSRLIVQATEKVELPSSIERVTMNTVQVTRELSEQRSFDGGREEDIDPAPLLNSLVITLGDEHVCWARCVERYTPECSFEYSPVTAKSGESQSPLPFSMPPHLLPEPEPITCIAMLPDKPPSWFEWRGNQSLVKVAQGPERISNEWFLERRRPRRLVRSAALPQADAARLTVAEQRREVGWPSGDRDYFQIQDETGRWFWVFRDNAAQRWFLHGVWS